MDIKVNQSNRPRPIKYNTPYSIGYTPVLYVPYNYVNYISCPDPDTQKSVVTCKFYRCLRQTQKLRLNLYVLYTCRVQYCSLWVGLYIL